MAKDDYFVIMYLLLKQLYSLLKQGQSITNDQLEQLGSQYNAKYWQYILMNMTKEGYITGVTKVTTLSGETLKYQNVQITPAGIEYLFSNSMMERVKNTLKDIKDIIPGV